MPPAIPRRAQQSAQELAGLRALADELEDEGRHVEFVSTAWGGVLLRVLVPEARSPDKTRTVKTRAEWNALVAVGFVTSRAKGVR